MRWARIPDFDARRPQADWPDLRSFDWVTVPEAWGTTVDEATRADLTDLVADALEARLGYAPPVSGPALFALDTVAAANKARVTRAGPDVARLARAWANSHRVTLTSALSSDDPGAEIATLFDANGVLDFRDLSDDDIPAWLDALGWWSAGMPATTDPATAGVSAEQLAAADSAATVARRERERQRRLVRIGDHDVDVGTGAGDMAALIEALQVNLDANPAVIAAPNRISDLQPMPATRPRGGGGEEVVEAGTQWPGCPTSNVKHSGSPANGLRTNGSPGSTRKRTSPAGCPPTAAGFSPATQAMTASASTSGSNGHAGRSCSRSKQAETTLACSP